MLTLTRTLALLVVLLALLGCGDATAPVPDDDWDGTYTVTRWQIGTVEFPALCSVEGLALYLDDADGVLTGHVAEAGTVICDNGERTTTAANPVTGTVAADRTARMVFGSFTITGSFYNGGYFAGRADAASGGFTFTGAFEAHRR